MKFTTYDLLSQLVLGFLWLIVMVNLFDIELIKGGGNDVPIVAIPIAYVLGYFINAIASWMESLLFATWGGKPSRRLLDGEGMKRIKFNRYVDARNLLIKERKLGAGHSLDNKAKDDLFNIALSYGGTEKNNRILAFNASYAFSRGLVISLIGIWIMVLINWLFGSYADSTINIVWLILTTIALLAAWYRTKERGYYLAREVLSNYLRIKQNQLSEDES